MKEVKTLSTFFEGLHFMHNNVNDADRYSDFQGDTDVPQEEHVECPWLKFTPCPLLQQSLSNSNQFAVNCIALYLTAISTAGQHLHSHCSLCSIEQ